MKKRVWMLILSCAFFCMLFGIKSELHAEERFEIRLYEVGDVYVRDTNANKEFAIRLLPAYGSGGEINLHDYNFNGARLHLSGSAGDYISDRLDLIYDRITVLDDFNPPAGVYYMNLINFGSRITGESGLNAISPAFMVVDAIKNPEALTGVVGVTEDFPGIQINPLADATCELEHRIYDERIAMMQADQKITYIKEGTTWINSRLTCEAEGQSFSQEFGVNLTVSQPTEPPVKPAFTYVPEKRELQEGYTGTQVIGAVITEPAEQLHAYTYSITDTTEGTTIDHFTIDAPSGQVSLLAGVEAGTYTFEITATRKDDAAVSQTFGGEDARLMITSAATNTEPVFTYREIKHTVEQGSTESLGTVDVNPTEQLTAYSYRVTDSEHFLIDVNTGVVSLRADAPVGSYSLIIQATKRSDSTIVHTLPEQTIAVVEPSAEPVPPVTPAFEYRSSVGELYEGYGEEDGIDSYSIGMIVKKAGTGTYTYEVTPSDIFSVDEFQAVYIKAGFPAGTYPYTVTVKEGTAKVFTQSHTVTVKSTAPAACPIYTFQEKGDLYIEEGYETLQIGTILSNQAMAETSFQSNQDAISVTPDGKIMLKKGISAGTLNFTITAEDGAECSQTMRGQIQIHVKETEPSAFHVLYNGKRLANHDTITRVYDPGNAVFTLASDDGSTLTFTTDSTIVEIKNGKGTVKKAKPEGITITASNGTDTVSLTMIIEKGKQDPVKFAEPALTWGQGVKEITPVIQGGSGTGAFVLTSSNSSLIKVSGNRLIYVNGTSSTVVIQAIRKGDENYLESKPATLTITLPSKAEEIDPKPEDYVQTVYNPEHTSYISSTDGFPSNTAFLVRDISDTIHEETVEKAYQLSLTQNGTQIPLQRKARVSINLPSAFIGEDVTYQLILADGSEKAITPTITGNLLTFETDQLGTLHVSRQAKSPSSTPEPQDSANQNTDGELGVRTGDSISLYGILVICISSMLALTYTIKKTRETHA